VGRLDYDPRRGTFRGWLFTVVRNELRDFLGRRRRQVQGSGDTGVQQALNEQPAPGGGPEEEWDRAYERRLFTWAAEQVRAGVQSTTWQAFWQTAVEGKSGQEVAKALGMSVAAVYLAKSRVMARLKEQIQQLQGE
jgi:RNA polymerase sigma-70 factor (ECF subfamily)